MIKQLEFGWLFQSNEWTNYAPVSYRLLFGYLKTWLGTHISPELCQMSQKAIKHTQWYVQTVQNSDRDTTEAPMITRLMRDLRNRNQAWILEFLLNWTFFYKTVQYRTFSFLYKSWNSLSKQGLLLYEQMGLWFARHTLDYESPQFRTSGQTEPSQSNATNNTATCIGYISTKLGWFEWSYWTRLVINDTNHTS